MVSLSIIIAMVISSYGLVAFVTGWTAGMAGSKRGRFVYGLLVSLWVLFSSVALQAIYASSYLPMTLVAVCSVLGFWLIATFYVLKTIFDLSPGRTFAPFGGYIACQILFVALMLGVIRPFVAEAYVLPSWSMAPTLERGDHFFVCKLLRPRRFDLVAYWCLGGTSRRMIFCKRLIALPGEKLRFENGDIYINGRKVDAPAVLAGKCHAWLPGAPESRYVDGQTITLGDNEYFLLGDKVGPSADSSGSFDLMKSVDMPDAVISDDSRFCGPSKGSDIVGVVDLRYWPLQSFTIFR